MPKAQGVRYTERVWYPAADVYQTPEGWLVKVELALWEAWKEHDAKKLDASLSKDVSFVNIFGTYLGTATNQQAEIAAAAVGLEALRQPCNVRLLTDSRYVVETMNGRFRRKANLPWWQRLDRAAAAHKVRWEWTRGHAGHLLQEAADSAARRIAAAGHVEESILRDTEEKLGTIEA